MEQTATPSTSTPTPPASSSSSGPVKAKRFPAWIGLVIAVVVVAAGAAFVNLNKQVAQVPTTDTRSQAASSCAWCAGNDQCLPSTGHNATAVSTSMCSNGFCCIFNPDTTTQPTPSGGGGNTCDNDAITASACRGVQAGLPGNGTGGICTCQFTTGTHCACVAPSPTPSGGTAVCSGACNPPNVVTCGSGLIATSDSSCGTGSNIRCCQPSSLHTCYNRYSNPTCQAVQITQNCDGVNNFSTQAACQAAVNAGSTYCYILGNNCARSANPLASCNNTGNFESQAVCGANLCPAGSTFDSSTALPCYCGGTGAGRTYFNPSGGLPAACQQSTECSHPTNRSIGCACSTTSQCITGSVCNNNKCTSSDIYPACAPTSQSGDCVQGASPAITGANVCRQGGTSNLFQCCPSGQTIQDGRCVNDSASYPACPPTSQMGEYHYGFTPAISGATLCRPGTTTQIVQYCPVGKVIQNNACVTAGTGGPNPGTCNAAGNTCSTASSANGNCCSGSYCTGQTGSQYCNVPADNAEQRCINEGGVCGGTGGFLGFRCTNLTNGQCLENKQVFNTFADARNYAAATGCGQVDTTCVSSGSMNQQLCGGFEIISTNCGGTPSSPQPSPTPTPTPPAPVCLNIAMSPATPAIGSSVTFTCGQVSGVNHYEFRVKLPNGTIQTLAAAAAGGRVSVPLSVTAAGTYQAQCRICTGADSNTCQAFEPL